MNRPYLGPEKIPEIHFIDYNIDNENHGEHRSLIQRTAHEGTGYRRSDFRQKVMTAVIVLLLTGLAAVICALQSGCEGEGTANEDCHPKLTSSLFKWNLVWNKLGEPPPYVGLTDPDNVWKRPRGWAGGDPYPELDRRSEGEAWKNPKGWKPIHDLEPEKRSQKATGPPSEATDSSMITPLYCAPGDNATNWQSTFETINSSSSVYFTIIVNPENGPGTGDLNGDLQAGIEKLKSFPNVRVLGYVHQSYGARDLSDIESDLDAYASWREPKTDITLDGIFFDESPADAAHAPYVATVNAYAKDRGLDIVMQNPGTVPDEAYFEPGQQTDVNVIFEGGFHNYASTEGAYDGVAAKYGVSNSALGLIIYDGPTDANDVQTAVAKMTKQVGHVFMSGSSRDNALTANPVNNIQVFTTAMVLALP
ncbi:hypothetical protein TWF696_002472 [Orbilia brochopaga]|uniref:Spherulin-4 n=1 Tax=Orbilia brochopaga TaxID=3140254 RepID=A0AAV9U2G5_9PEZI